MNLEQFEIFSDNQYYYYYYYYFDVHIVRQFIDIVHRNRLTLYNTNSTTIQNSQSAAIIMVKNSFKINNAFRRQLYE